MTVVLGDDAAALGIALYGHVVGERVAANDGGAGMHALATHLAFDGLGSFDYRLTIGVVLIDVLQVGVRIERLLNGDADFAADELANLVAHRIRVVEHARGIAHGVLRLQLAERDNARDMVFAVKLAYVLDNVLAMLIVEVDVDIGHLDTFHGKETFEEQAIRQRIEVGNAHGIRNDGASSGATAWAYADAVVLGPHDVFLHDEEVRGEALLDDNAGLVLVALDNVGAHLAQLFHIGGLALAIAIDEALFAFLTEP